MVYGKPTFLCIKCQKNFIGFKGMVRRGAGLGYCEEHTPRKKNESPTEDRPDLEKPKDEPPHVDSGSK